MSMIAGAEKAQNTKHDIFDDELLRLSGCRSVFNSLVELPNPNRTSH